ncbi:MAG TPA: hypothetical protein VHL09_08280 [Dehalococcoidia bacterium]|nr:hypothetical protein [Dehalococcoidia bacterium]
MVSLRSARAPVKASSQWLQLGGFLLAALLALVTPSSADHVDAIFGQHLHDPITRRVVPLTDDRGHRHQAAPDEVRAAGEGHLDVPHTSTILSLDRLPVTPAGLGTLWLTVAFLPVAVALRLQGRAFGPAPPPPRS